jgi:GDP-L-fucose synthase
MGNRNCDHFFDVQNSYSFLDMKILITGHKGLLGSACVRLFQKEHEVVENFAQDLRVEKNVDVLMKMHKPDQVIHCAAKVGGVKANREFPVDFMLDNLRMQCNIIEACANTDVKKLCFVATSCMFPRDAELPVNESTMFTGKLEDSVEAYAIAKIAGWRLCKAYYEQYGKRFLTVAPSNIYGPQDNYGESAHVIPALIKKYAAAVRNKTGLEVWGDGTAIREFIYSDDVATAIQCVMDKWDSPEVINVGSGLGTSIADLVGLIAQTSPYGPNERPQVTWNTAAPTGIPRKTFDIAKISSLGWKTSVGLEEGLRKTWWDFVKGNVRGL